MPPLTELAHSIVREIVHRGDVTIDATAGNGHDTRYLADLVGQTGLVWAIDVQQAAIEQTSFNLGPTRRGHVRLLHNNHADLKSLIPNEYHGHISVVMFNLGYLPGGDPSLTTLATTTLTAVEACLELLRPGGVLTLIAYLGQSGGAVEAEAIEGLLNRLDPGTFEVSRYSSAGISTSSPRLRVVRKRVPSGTFRRAPFDESSPQSLNHG